MVHHVMVEDIPIRETGKQKVETKNPDQGYDGEGDKLAGNVIARPSREGNKGGGVISGR